MKQSLVSAWTIVAFLIGTLFGSGGVWEWKKIEIERVVRTTDLREKENDQFAKILDLTNEYINATDQHSKAPNPQLNNKILQMKSHLEVMKDNFRTLENKLAQLEGREPRNIQIDFIPPAAPTLLPPEVH